MIASYHYYDSSTNLHKRPFFADVSADIEESRVMGTTHTVFAKYLPHNWRKQDYILLEMSPKEAKAFGERLISASIEVDDFQVLEVKP
jgi:hypothetical protein